MSNLEKVQKASNVLRIICKIIFVILAVCGLITLATTALTLPILGGAPYGLQAVIDSAVTDNAGNPLGQGQLCAACAIATAAILCGTILWKKAENYFKFELQEGTPFSYDGAARMKSLGIWVIVLPLAVGIAISIVCAALGLKDVIELGFSTESIIPGVLLIIVSMVLRHGADLRAQVEAENGGGAED